MKINNSRQRATGWRAAGGRSANKQVKQIGAGYKKKNQNKLLYWHGHKCSLDAGKRKSQDGAPGKLRPSSEARDDNKFIIRASSPRADAPDRPGKTLPASSQTDGHGFVSPRVSETAIRRTAPTHFANSSLFLFICGHRHTTDHHCVSSFCASSLGLPGIRETNRQGSETEATQ